MTYAGFARAIEGARKHLAVEALPAGHVAVVIIGNLRDCWIAVLALRALGLTTVCAQSLEQARSLSLRNLACVVTTDAEPDRQLLTGSALPGARMIVVPMSVLSDIADHAAPPGGSAAPGGHILHTSGSTGDRKKVLLTAEVEDAANADRAELLAYGPDSVHAGLDYGLWTGVGFKQSASVWHVGGRVVFDQRPDNLRNALAHGVNRMRLLPPLLKGVLDALGPASEPRDGLEIGTGGVLVPLDLAERTVARLTRNLKIAYSATELSSTPMQSDFRSADDLQWLRPMGNRVADVVDDDGTPCPADHEGTLRIRIGPFDATSYLDDATATAGAFRDGYFYPGDIAVKRGDGRVRLLGRADDIINIGGQKIATAPLEQALQRDLRVAEICLLSRQLASGKQELMIAIETDRELPEYELDALARQFASFERVGVTVLKDFPRTRSGTRKVQRFELRKRLFVKDGEPG